MGKRMGWRREERGESGRRKGINSSLYSIWWSSTYKYSFTCRRTTWYAITLDWINYRRLLRPQLIWISYYRFRTRADSLSYRNSEEGISPFPFPIPFSLSNSSSFHINLPLSSHDSCSFWDNCSSSINRYEDISYSSSYWSTSYREHSEDFAPGKHCEFILFIIRLLLSV